MWFVGQIISRFSYFLMPHPHHMTLLITSNEYFQNIIIITFAIYENVLSVFTRKKAVVNWVLADHRVPLGHWLPGTPGSPRVTGIRVPPGHWPPGTPGSLAASSWKWGPGGNCLNGLPINPALNFISLYWFSINKYYIFYIEIMSQCHYSTFLNENCKVLLHCK